MKFIDISINEKFVFAGRVYVRLNHHETDSRIVNAQLATDPSVKLAFAADANVSFGDIAYTPAEAQAILAFVERALARSDKRGGSIGYNIQMELNKMCEQLGIKQGFDRILPTMADENLGYVGPSFEVVNL